MTTDIETIRAQLNEALRRLSETEQTVLDMESSERESKELLRRALPLLEKLGDFIGNGPIDPSRPSSYGERCDLILDIKNALIVGEQS